MKGKAMVQIRYFATVRDAAGRGRDELPAGTLEEALGVAGSRYGDAFRQAVSHSKVWVNGEEVEDLTDEIGPDEVAIIPPVAGG